MQIQVYVVALSILILGPGTKVDAESLPPPSNVSIKCDSYKVEVHWQYPYAVENVVFRVEVKDKSGIEFDDTSEHWMNISNMLMNPVFNHYVVFVTAKQGDKMSKKSDSKTFSFNEHATSTIKCQLEFPDVKLSPKEGNLHLEFTNPLYLYRNTPALRNNTDMDFEFWAESEEITKTSNSCGRELKTCEASFAFAKKRDKYCLNLTGEIGQRLLKQKRQCFIGDLTYYPPITTYLYPLLGVVLSLLFISFIIMLLAKICNEQIKKKAATAFPSFLDFKPPQTHLCKPLKTVQENVASDLRIELVTHDPAENTMLIEIDPDEQQSSDWQSSSVDSKNYNKYGGDGDLEDARSSSDLDLGETVNSCHTHTSRSISDTSAGYDCPHVLRLEMSPGDEVQGYRN
ncbi:interferon gamma receptor 1 [Triplophysa rosa]|uniref:Interferon gamma receptor 1-1 n=1 Tax=Triplophysa rosa TaxID=992332 RepID=A0A9W7WYD6_TRIRA|nr:interferon gamma receptor 1 [Triplophysa rosa]KAI7810499.1 interferon gamma receptor 1-1 [Triplophysa rosa]